MSAISIVVDGTAQSSDCVAVVATVTGMQPGEEVDVFYSTRARGAATTRRRVCRLGAARSAVVLIKNPRSVGAKTGNPLLGLGAWRGEIRFEVWRDEQPGEPICASAWHLWQYKETTLSRGFRDDSDSISWTTVQRLLDAQDAGR